MKLKKEGAALRVLKNLQGGVFVSLQKCSNTKSGFGMLGRCFARKEKREKKKAGKNDNSGFAFVTSIN